MREALKNAKRLVIKVGSSLVTNQGQGLDHAALARWVEQIAALKKRGKEVLLVSSGAIAEGMQRLGWPKRPHSMHELQAAAAVGQMGLIQAYESCFRKFGLHTAQILLTRDGLESRNRSLNAKRTLEDLFSLKALPIVNENDTVATEEIAFGDNDLLSVWVATLVDADLLIILSDVDGFYLADGSRIRAVEEWGQIEKLSSHLRDEKKAKTVGGMKAKLSAARLAMQSGIPILLVNGHEKNILQQVMAGEDVGTLFAAGEKKRTARENWIAFSAPKKGTLMVDKGACQALVEGQKSLLARGILRFQGKFNRGDVVELCHESQIFGRGVVGYSSDEIAKIVGRKTNEIETALGYKHKDEVVHRNDLVVWSK